MSPLARIRARRAAKHELPWSEELLTRWKGGQEVFRVKTRKKRLRSRFVPRTGGAAS